MRSNTKVHKTKSNAKDYTIKAKQKSVKPLSPNLCQVITILPLKTKKIPPSSVTSKGSDTSIVREMVARKLHLGINDSTRQKKLKPKKKLSKEKSLPSTSSAKKKVQAAKPSKKRVSPKKSTSL